MSLTQLESSPIVEAYRARTRESAALASNAAAQFPSGITHDSRHLFDPTACLSTVHKERENGMWTAMNMLITSAATAHCYSVTGTRKCWQLSTKLLIKAPILAPVIDTNWRGPVLFNDSFQLPTVYGSPHRVLKPPIWRCALQEPLPVGTK